MFKVNTLVIKVDMGKVLEKVKTALLSGLWGFSVTVFLYLVQGLRIEADTMNTTWSLTFVFGAIIYIAIRLVGYEKVLGDIM